MAVSFGCRCAERKKPVNKRRWVVVTRRGNNSAFAGYRWTSSDYSLVYCQNCKALGRTKAAYVSSLKDGEIK